MQEHSSTAKITKPTVSGIFQRERLFRLFDDNRKRPVVWVSGPAGSGKTTLVASYLDARNLPCLWYVVDQGDADIATFFYYIGRAAEKESARDQKPLPLLTPEYFQGIPTFTKRYFENLCSRFSPPFIFVFDNYQDAPPDSDFHDMIASGLEVIPEGINVIILSRHEPPRQIARLRANNRICSVGWDEIRFTFEESREVVRMYGRENLTDETLAEVYGKTEGWMAGLVLYMEGTKRAGIDPIMLSRLVPETVFDYFATEIFERTDPVTREFLLKTSMLPSMTLQMAERLTGVPAAADILSQLYRSHYFIEMRTSGEPVYHYHPLFREFLLSRTKSLLSSADRTFLLRNAAGLLEESGQIEHAVLLLRDARDWEGLVSVILKQAGPLTTQGRGSTLQEWLTSIPEEIVRNTPWLLYWKGICRMPFNLVESRNYLDQAFQAFRRQKDPAGLYLSWSGVINTFVYEWGDFSPVDRWISEMEKLFREYPEFPSPEIEAWVTYGMFSALMYRRPHHPDFPLWEKRAIAIVLSSTDVRLRTMIGNQLITHYTWQTGDLAKASFLIDKLKSVSQDCETDPLAFIVWCSFKAAYHWMTASHEDCIQAVNEGLQTAEETGIHIWDSMLWTVGAMLTTTSGNLDEAQMFLNKISAAINPTAFHMARLYHYSATFASLLRDDPVGALEHAQAAYGSAQKAGVPCALAYDSIALGSMLLEHGERERGLAHLADARRIASSIKSDTAACLSLICEAQYFLQRNETESGLEALAKAMATARRQGFVNHSAWRPSVMSFLCAKALEAGIETDYVRKLIKQRNLTPPDINEESNVQSAIRNLKLEEWPWPLRIQTLGKFQVVKDDVAVAFSGKVQQKPLSLLKAIIAYGGRDVSRQRLIDALWPDADGAKAHQSFEIALHRLRRLIGDDKAVLLNQGSVTLDPRRCWVDVFALDRFFEETEEAFQRKPTNDALNRVIHFMEKIVGLYKGHYLEQEAEQSWSISLRERLHAKFLHSVAGCGRYLEKAGQKEKAVEYLEKGLERDNLYEEFYQQLMACYHKLGRPSAAEDVYRRCRSVLSASLGVSPSPITQEIYSRISR